MGQKRHDTTEMSTDEVRAAVERGGDELVIVPEKPRVMPAPRAGHRRRAEASSRT